MGNAMRTTDYFDKQAILHPDRTLLIAGSTRLSYAEVQLLTHRIAGGMLREGFQHQQAVAIMSPNHSAVVTLSLIHI